MTATEAEHLPLDNTIEQRLSGSRFRCLRRWTTRAITCAVFLGLLAFGILYLRMDFPNEVQLLGKRRDTSFFARMQGNHIVSEILVQESTIPQVIGHRGSGLRSSVNPILSIGNTEGAIRAAIDADVSWIEIDIRISLDGELVVFHDKTLGEKTNCDEKLAEKGICDLNWSELASLHLNLNPPEQLLKLEEVLEKFGNPSLKWILDIKPERDESLDQLKKEKLLPIIRDLGPDRVVLFGNYEILNLYKQAGERLSEYDCGLLMLVRDNFWTFLFNQQRIITKCKKLDVKYCVIPGMFAESHFISRLREERLNVLVWDCENPVDQTNFVARGVAGLIVDKPLATKAKWAR